MTSAAKWAIGGVLGLAVLGTCAFTVVNTNARLNDEYDPAIQVTVMTPATNTTEVDADVTEGADRTPAPAPAPTPGSHYDSSPHQASAHSAPSADSY